MKRLRELIDRWRSGPELRVERARVVELEGKAKHQERSLVNLVAALRQANARCIELEEAVLSLSQQGRWRSCGRPVDLSARERWH